MYTTVSCSSSTAGSFVNTFTSRSMAECTCSEGTPPTNSRPLSDTATSRARRRRLWQQLSRRIRVEDPDPSLSHIPDRVYVLTMLEVLDVILAMVHYYIWRRRRVGRGNDGSGRSRKYVSSTAGMKRFAWMDGRTDGWIRMGRVGEESEGGNQEGDYCYRLNLGLKLA